ncbi:MAG: Inner membrane ABC transporter permease protein YtfT [Firmicutes bacterium ADurb.Bin182]|nr:MAG: Inner membrane ABC transporter permease protein YtfT [Firmicutes bacterium ADurb.Bin182]
MDNGLKKFSRSQLVVPLFSLFLLIVFNLIRDVGFFSVIVTTNNEGNTVLSGNLISILNGASELAIIAIGMTLVTASSGGQDISVGAAAAIAGSVFVRVLRENQITMPIILAAFLAGCVVAIIFGSFNGTLVAAFKIQPMIATLILFTAGRPIAYWINGGATPTVSSSLLNYIGSFIPGIPIPTPIIIVIIFGVLVSLVLRFTNLRLYTQAVGINERSARLTGINAAGIKLLSFMILGVCVAISGSIGVSRIGLINHETLLLDIEMDAILAVAIGGNSLGGGKFSLTGSVIGAYIIQALTITLYAMKVSSTAVKAYKAIVIIAIVIISSPIVKEYALRLRGRLLGKPKEVTENQ